MQSTTEWRRTHNCPSPKEIHNLLAAYGRKPATANGGRVEAEVVL